MEGTEAITNSQDVIDSRDIIVRLVYLGDNKQDLDDDEKAELTALTALAEEGEGYAEDWQYGVQLIRESYFKEYAQELAEDVGDMPKDVRWPFTCIDWDQAAEELKQDYTSVEFDGITYYIR